MKIAEGVYLHFIKSHKFKTNHIKVRFTGQRDEATLARRALVAQMLESVNSIYSTQQAFRQELARLYGASFSTSISTRGLSHMVDVNMSFVRESFLMSGDSILDSVLSFLEAALFHPLVSVAQYKPKQFDIEKQNLINSLEADLEDPYYASDLAVRALYFGDTVFKYSKYGNPELIKKEDSYTVFQEFQHMLQQDRIDIFVLGEVEDYRVIQKVNHFPLEDRKSSPQFSVKHQFTNITREKIERRDTHQTILNLAYHLPVTYGSDDYFALLLVNGLLGGYAHSKLFTNVREKAGLAYTIASQYDVSTQYLKIYAGIDRENRQRTLRLINQQLSSIRLGKFSKREIEQTKKMLVNQARITEDYPDSLMELRYNKEIYGEQALELEEWLQKINTVGKKDMMRVAQQLKLQALYILEGQ